MSEQRRQTPQTIEGDPVVDVYDATIPLTAEELRAAQREDDPVIEVREATNPLTREELRRAQRDDADSRR